MPSAIIGAPDLMAMFVHVKLVRKLCSCAFSYSQHDSKEVINAYTETEQLDKLDLKVAQLQKLFSDSKQLDNAKILNPLGCEHCKSNEGTIGEKGRLVVMEMILLDDEDRKFIINEDDLGWKAHLKAKGWPDIREHCKSRISKGQVDILSASEQVDDLIPVPITDIYHALSSSLEGS